MLYFFVKDNFLYSLHFGFAGAWKYTYLDLDDSLLLIREYCPQLITSFLSSSEQEEINLEGENATGFVES